MLKKIKIKKDYGPKHPYIKLKIDTTFPDNKVKSIVFNSVMKDGKRVRTKVDDIVTIDDLAKSLCFMSKIRPIGRPIKLWAQAANKKDPTYGLTFKMAKVEVEPPTKTKSNIKEYIESDVFLDSDNESDTEPMAKSTVFNMETPKATTKKVAEVDSDSDQESDDEVVTQVKTVAGKKSSSC